MAGKLKIWNASTNSWDYISSEVSLSKSTGAIINTGTEDTKFVTAKAIADSFLGSKVGWSPLGAASYDSADAPTYTILFAPGVLDDRITKGTRIKLTDGTVKYFIVTLIATDGGGNNIVFLYGGTDYTLSGGAITNISYSNLKSPIGFPLDPIKWTQTFTGLAQVSTGNIAALAITNFTNYFIDIPIGSWKVIYGIKVSVTATSSPYLQATIGLSTTNSTFSDIYLKADSAYSSVAAVETGGFVSRQRNLLINTKTRYYLNAQPSVTNSTLYAQGHIVPTTIEAICNYL